VRRAPRLITLDHHTDTSAPFRTYLKQHPDEREGELLGAIRFRDPASVEAALDKLAHDEHIVTALRADVLSAACVLAQNAMDTDAACFAQHAIICREVRRDEWDRVLESELLDRAIAGFDALLAEPLLDGDYILDVDLDVFKTFASIAPKDASTFRRLAGGARLITVATEPDFVRRCAVDAGLDSDYLLAGLRRLLA